MKIRNSNYHINSRQSFADVS